MYDIAVIGTGPAGISAAITGVIRNKNVILIGQPVSEKVEKAHTIDNYPGLAHISGKDLAQALKSHLDSLGIQVTPGRVGAVYAMGDHFELQHGENFVPAKSVIIATGVAAGKMIEGEEELLGRGVSYCATCDGMLYKGRDVIVIGANDEAASEAEYLSEIVAGVKYLPAGGALPKSKDNIDVIAGKPLKITGENGIMTLETDQASYTADCIFVIRDAVRPGSLVPGLETDGPHIKVDLNMCTNIEGLFACGDVAGLPYQYIKSAGQGNVAALSAVKYLAGLKN